MLVAIDDNHFYEENHRVYTQTSIVSVYVQLDRYIEVEIEREG